MKPVVEHLELRQNNFTRWLFLTFTILSLFAFIISWNKEGNIKWICFAGVLLFGSGYWMVLKYLIVADQNGFTEQYVFRTRHILWQEISSIKYESVYNIHGVSLQLSIFYGTPQKAFHLQVEQYNKKKMERFFEMLNEQCPFAEKNDHFIKKATGVMGWKDKLKMY